MAPDAGRLVSLLSERAGDNLRAVGVYDADHERWAYRRADVRDQFDATFLSEVVDSLCTDDERRAEEEWTFRTGETKATLRVFTDTVFVHLHTDGGGAFVVLDAHAAVYLTSFVSECRHALDS